ncbi:MULTISPECIES: 3-methyl-2-oxobutanoate hydroxymethyltransferase [unclassified Nitrosomonas]|uniref:3-methyl-2-oxobutanoate hydroxymethyltransferase n=1 Tax=unclassified Nitrosomonas TaxID=2609265 RepID=UPI00089D84F4|nr:MULTISPECIES: 3-methyl-2-oxobutanoate hydroxymethyltransferase [unclassified Nitrosomonas]MDV6343077.1 3-methyl-2-oxobutanoate hydroxymethyltransferase [Nitrosomonas sp. Is37]SDY49914.1 3-methyl-2-oxobutanoate hydroxymethyltransferase [Nitrosomonas sp. Nm33]
MRITRDTLQKMHSAGNKIAALTCYDATFAVLLENAGVDILLIGDSLGNVIQGHTTTLPVTLDDMIYHTQCVVRGSNKAFIMVDMPFGTSQVSPEETFMHAARLMAAGAQMVKIEGGHIMTDTIDFLTQRGIPVCAHIGLMPQSVHQLGGYKVQGRTANEAEQLLSDAILLQEAGVGMLLMETIPAALAAKISRELSIPTIGIGAGVDCSAQILVLHDMLGIYPGSKPRFVKNFMTDADSIQAAIEHYVEEVKTGKFPAAEHTF